MQFWLGVENFAKIESAKICIDRYTLLVGQNNSGKTFLMQLAYEIIEKLASLIDDDMINGTLVQREDVYDVYAVSCENISRLVDGLNKKLHTEKENIVREIFGKDIDIGELYVDIALEEDSVYEMILLDATKDYEGYIEKAADKFLVDMGIFQRDIYLEEIGIANRRKRNEKAFETVTFAYSYSKLETYTDFFRRLFRNLTGWKSLYLPASRNGLLLLYRDFFVNRADSAMAYRSGRKQSVAMEQNYGGLTKPVYEFLRFLQTYAEWKRSRVDFKDELQFFENKLVGGSISADRQNTFFYRPDGEENEIPMYLASSMINELAPIVMAILSENDYRRLIIDEAEASLHPEKQLELVRFLNRLNHKGMQLIISTHSDTFVSKMNNLYILSQYVKRTGDMGILKKFGLEKADLIDPGNMFVYEFVIRSNGKSVVKELKGDEKTGYQFDQFTGPAMQLYEEALRLGEIR